MLEIIVDTIEVFMDIDFSVMSDTFESCLENL